MPKRRVMNKKSIVSRASCRVVSFIQAENTQTAPGGHGIIRVRAHDVADRKSVV